MAGVKIQLRRDTAANWTSANPTLASGTPGYETDTGLMKIGDGATAWNSLGYFSSGGGTPTDITVASDTTTNPLYLAAFTGQTGDRAPKTNPNLRFDPTTGIYYIGDSAVADGHLYLADLSNAAYNRFTSVSQGVALTSTAGAADFSVSGSIGVGSPGVATGVVSIAGVTSGNVNITIVDGITPWTLTLPPNDGTAADQSLLTNGSGVTSWGYPNAATVTAADETSDTTCFVGFVTAATGNLGVKTNAGLTFNSATGMLTATGFTGPLTGTASLASTVTLADESSDATCFIVFSTTATGSQALKTSSATFKFDSTTGKATITGGISTLATGFSLNDYVNSKTTSFALGQSNSTAQVWTIPAGTTTFVGTDISQAISAKTITASSVNSTPIGQSVPDAGAFTDLGASGDAIFAGTSCTTLDASGAITAGAASAITISIAANTAATGWLLTNTTAATSGNQRYSPATRWTGQGWKTDATAASRAVDFRAYVVPVQGAANPSGVWTLDSAINGGSFATVFSVTSGSVVQIGSGSGVDGSLLLHDGTNNVNITIAAGDSSISITGPDVVDLHVGDDLLYDDTAASLVLGNASGQTGKVKLKGTTSGTVTITVAPAAGTAIYSFPTTSVDGDVLVSSTNNQLGENSGFLYDAALSADGKYCATEMIDGTAGTTLAFGDLCYFAAADSRWELTDANAASTAGDVLIGICILAAAADGSATRIMLRGTIRADANFPSMTISAPQYLSETAGDLTGTQPTTTDVVIRRIGWARTADELYFCPSNDYITHV